MNKTRLFIWGFHHLFLPSGRGVGGCGRPWRTSAWVGGPRDWTWKRGPPGSRKFFRLRPEQKRVKILWEETLWASRDLKRSLKMKLQISSVTVSFCKNI